MSGDRHTENKRVGPPEAGGQRATQRFFELSILRAEDNVRIALLILLLVVALTSRVYVVSSLTLYTSLIIGVLLTLWSRFAARWTQIRAVGNIGTGAGVVLLAEFTWLALFVHGTGGLESPFAALLLMPIIFASAFFSTLRIGVALATGLVVAMNILFAVSRPADLQTPWRLSGMVFTVIAIAWVSYGLSLVLEQERRTNELVVRYLSEGVLLIDGTGWIRLVNPRLQRLTGLSAEHTMRLNARDVVEKGEFETLAEILRDVVAPETEAPTHVRDITIQGPEPIDLRLSTIRLGSPTRRPAGWLVVCQDVTELKSRVRMRDSGIRFLSHEIRSPLTSFKLISSVFAELADQLSDTGSAKLIEVVSNEADRMLRLVGQFLDVAALDEGSYRLNLREVDVSQLIHKVADALQIKAAEKGISVSTMCAEDIPLIQADPDRLEDVLHNLCENALKYTDAGGQISLAADVDDTDVQIAVSDTGRGIPADMHEAIFEEFVQAHHDVEGTRLEAGVGLGLYMVRRLVELHGGRVEVASEVGRGATFTIHLPIVLQSASPARPPTHG